MKTSIPFDNSYERLPALFYKKIPLHEVADPTLLYFNDDLAETLGLEAFNLKETGLQMFAGNQYPENASSIAQAYMGHQYGHLTMLGDGRANLIGEVVNPQGQRFDLQLKGSGPTPFSRGGDGRAALAPMLKEYLFSEALHQLGIPSSRSLALVTTGEDIYRQHPEAGAILTRVMTSHLRVGTFTYAATAGTKEDLKALVDYAIKRHHPQVANHPQPYHAFYEAVVKSQAETVAKWLAYGFVHGVMNTDNMAISGETFDYGPCAMLDAFDVQAVFSSIDHHGRYAYGNQPAIALWNLHRLGEALMPLLREEGARTKSIFNDITDTYRQVFTESYYQHLRARLGLQAASKENNQVAADFIAMLEKTSLDFHQTFIDLTIGALEEAPYQEALFQEWLAAWTAQVIKERPLEEARAEMKTINPSVVLRNYWVQRAIEEAQQGDFTLYERFYKALKNPFSYDESHKAFGPIEMNQPYVTFCGT